MVSLAAGRRMSCGFVAEACEFSMQPSPLWRHPRLEPRSGGREGDPAETLMQPARQGTCGDLHGWIPFPALRAAGMRRMIAVASSPSPQGRD